jgi:flavin reductase
MNMEMTIATDVDPIDRCDPSVFLAGMRKAASSVCVVTTDGISGRVGVTVSSMTSVSTDPPSVLICIKKDNFAAAAIAENKVFCVNILRQDQQDISDTFAGRNQATPDRFACATWSTFATKSPALVDAASTFDCVLADARSFGSHVIFIGGVIFARTDIDATTLVYHDRHYCSIGPSNRASLAG